MKKLKLKIARIAVAVLVLTSFASCDEVGDINPGGTTAEALAGDWFVSTTNPAGTVIIDHALFSTYNTAANDNTLWLDDHNTAASKKFKVKVNFNADGTFTATAAANAFNARTVTITAGKVEKDAATSKGGHTVNKISFKAEFSSEPGVIYSYEGHKRTGFYEDEY
ncbi:lipid-binding protein [Flavobacterium branchiicola]|uniref:Lipid-binding protein n=1 Tax=Flavobacterium branchiicola TaxID=1114875 RepID=A0ABV9PF80_9FLAO|nr:lipid-binding protein [Flavobacterium branchiicola]MBS7255390.1 hypothetical protein [Flavobacterium branchiicola]